MKKIVPMLLICLVSISVFGQNQKVVPTNQTIIRLTIIKDTNKILMRETEYGWMTPAIYFKEKQNIQEITDSLANTYGIKIKNLNLNGLFTYKYKFKPTADFRQLYTAKYESGDLKSTIGKEKLSWIPIEEALIKLGSTVQSLEDMTRQIIEYPETLWGGSFIIDKDANWKLTSKVENKFYSLMKNDKQ